MPTPTLPLCPVKDWGRVHAHAHRPDVCVTVVRRPRRLRPPRAAASPTSDVPATGGVASRAAVPASATRLRPPAHGSDNSLLGTTMNRVCDVGLLRESFVHSRYKYMVYECEFRK